MWRHGTFIVLAAVGTAAHAGDKPLVQAAPIWVKPPALLAAPKPQEEAPLTVLLSDRQVRFERGSITTFQRTILRIDTAQGLAAGNISLPWRPDVGDLSVHHVTLRRGSETIDVLATGQTFTVARREPNMEAATLDGVLTANLQVEGLQIGDVLEVEFSVSVRDPVLAGHVEQTMPVEGSLTIERARVRASWPRALPVRFRQSGPLPSAKPVQEGDNQILEITANRVQPYQGPKLAPARYQLGQTIEFSDFASWSEIGTLMAPLYEKAAALPASGPLVDEIAKIKASSTDPGTRAAAALVLVQQRIRYVALAMGAGGLVPAAADTTWSRRYGDCKAKTALLLAVLHALDIAAEPVAANIGGGDGMDERLPSVGAFNHVLVRATIAGKVYWLDGTRTGDTSLDRLTVPNFGWGLPLTMKGAALTRMVPPPLTTPTSEAAVTIDASAGILSPAPFEVTLVLRGDAAIGASAGFGALSGDARDRSLRELWKRSYDFVDVETTKTAFDRTSGEFRLAMAGKAKLDVSRGQYEPHGLELGYRADFAREPGPDRDAPYAVDYPTYERVTETIRLPPGFPETVPSDKVAIDRTIAGVEYRRSAEMKDRVFKAVWSTRSVAPEFSASEAPAAQIALRAMADDNLVIRVPSAYRTTPADLAALEKEAPTTATGYVFRGVARLNFSRFENSIKDFDAALAIEPKNPVALAGRGMARVWTDQVSLAEADFLAVEAIDPRSITMLRGRGLAAERRRDFAGAVKLFTEALEVDPRDAFALYHRAQSYRGLKRPDAALADTATILVTEPGSIDTRLLRANILKSQAKIEPAIAEMRAAVAVAPNDPVALVSAANVLAALGRRGEAMNLFDRALAVKKDAYVFINRAEARSYDDLAGRSADYDAAFALAPKSPQAIAGKAYLVGKKGNWSNAIKLYDQAVALQPASPTILAERGVAKVQAGQAAAADRDFAAARTLAKGSASALNELCWAKAKLGAALESALTDCNAALALDPTLPTYLDSKGLVLLRMGRIEEAISVYGEALSGLPDFPSSLFGRSVAFARKGDKVRSDADAKAALAVSPSVADQFADYGVRR